LTPTSTTIKKPYEAPLPQNTNVRGKAVVQQGKVAPKGLERPDNPFAPALVPFANQLAFGALERNTDAVADVSAKNPVASTIGNIAGYGAKFTMLGGANSALSSPLTKGGRKEYCYGCCVRNNSRYSFRRCRKINKSIGKEIR